LEASNAVGQKCLLWLTTKTTYERGRKGGFKKKG